MLTTTDILEIKEVQKLLEEKLSKAQKSIYLDYTKEYTLPILKDRVGLKRILGIIQTGSNEQIRWEERVGPRGIPHTSAGDTDIFTPRFTPAMPLGIDISVADPAMLKQYFEQVLKKASKNKYDSKKIEIIEIVRRGEDEKVQLILNENVEKPIKVSAEKGRWKTFLEVAEHGSASSDSAKSVADYFNVTKSCPIYTNTDYDLTEILIAKGDHLYPAPDIKIIFKGPKTIARRKNKNT